ncbi:MAG: DegT/DnrJ/EryC1/StrS family aminotransferase [Bacteroidota bacterium]|nr:DegT/DnrJ/EryC1/StrS family aminotransferase [Bacteroidota bacterium]
MNVPLLDLKLQYQNLKAELDDAVKRVVESQYFILGPEVEKMERAMNRYLGCKHSLGVSSGTDALLLALMAIGIQPGDEVIVPTYSFFATAGVVARLHAKPVFVDVDKVTMNINPAEIEKKITAKTKAIIPVHLYGQSADMEPIMAIAKKHKLLVVEDAAQAIGAQYKDGRHAGTIGDIGCFSFFPSKNLGCFGDGGLVTTNDDSLGERMKDLRVHGMNPKYYHKYIGGNFRIDALQAAVLSVKLPYLDSWSEGRRKNAELYSKLFIEAGLAECEGATEYDGKNRVLLPKAVYREAEYRIQNTEYGIQNTEYGIQNTEYGIRNTEYRSTKIEGRNGKGEVRSEKEEGRIRNYHIYNQFIIRVQQRDALRTFITGKGIGNDVYYPVPFHRQECFQYLKPNDKDYPVSNDAASQSLALPIFPELQKEQIEYVVAMISEFMRG